ncbi:MAG: translation elongation factor-like protein [Nitrospirae bacterium]|nr:translation elongation factor-like protein [Nitrospirota bacterium]
MELKAGVITHLYKKIGVAVLDLSEPLQVGDTIRILGRTTDITQKVESMQIEHQNVERAEKGQCIGLKVQGDVREKDLVYKVV